MKEYFEINGGCSTCDQIVLEPEDWSDSEWAVFLKLFNLKEADRIVLADYKVDIYGGK